MLPRALGGATSFLIAFLVGAPVMSQVCRPLAMHEERALCVRDPAGLPHAKLPAIGPPITIASPPKSVAREYLSLDEAIRIAIDNSEVIRVLAGVQAVASGSTIYDPPITGTTIEEQKSRFDPSVDVSNLFNHDETPYDPVLTDNYDLDVGLSKTTITGGTARFGAQALSNRYRPGPFPLNPITDSALELSFTQPLLQGGRIGPNLAPIVIARIDTERSYFRFKDSMQQMVRGVIDAYWTLVYARVDCWAREQQVEQAQRAYQETEAKFRAELLDIGDVTQTQLALANFRSNLVQAKANVLAQEAALRNLIGLPPSHTFELVPTSSLTTEQVPLDWSQILTLAETRRPDLIELKLIIEADQQLLLQANNQALPRVDAVGLYRWNGLEGRMPDSTWIASGMGKTTDWTLGVTFSVPLGLRESRANLRRQELVIARDRANLDQGLHSAVHILAENVRNLAYLYAQYQALTEARLAARKNLDVQIAEYRARRVIFLNVLQAITSWGDAVSAEARAITLYNTELANLERETGTILETHGITFVEERYGSIGPLGRLAQRVCYPRSICPGPNTQRYPDTDGPAEESFDLSTPDLRRGRREPERLPPPIINAPPPHS